MKLNTNEPEPYVVKEGLKVQVGRSEGDWIELFPNVKVETLDDRDKIITIKGVFRLQGSGPATWTVTRFV